jgi:hypothetical protein
MIFKFLQIHFPNHKLNKEISLATTPIRTLLQTTMMKKLIHKMFVIKYDSSCFPIVTVVFVHMKYLFDIPYLPLMDQYSIRDSFLDTDLF